MRRLLSALLTALTLGAAAVIGYLWIQSAVDPTPISLESVDGRAVIAVSQPPAPKVAEDLDNSGYDISFPQCGRKLSSKSVGFAIIGLNYGKPFTANPCFAKQWQWAIDHDAAAIYINMADPGEGSAAAYGRKIAKDTMKRLTRFAVAGDVPIWLDIETHNTWAEPARSIQVITATAESLAAAGHPVGIYAPPVHWFEITGNATLTLPTWLALGKYPSTSEGVAAAKTACAEVSFGNQIPAMVQFVTKRGGRLLDHNLICRSPSGLVRGN